MTTRIPCLIALLLLLGCSGDPPPTEGHDAASTATARPTAGAKGLADDGALQLSEQDRCPVCAMVPKKRPGNAAAIELHDGTTHYFCGTGCMIRSWMHPDAYLGVERDQLKRAVVQEYFEGRPVDGSSVTFVAGSDVVGPMGPALVPLASEADVATFAERHGGTERFTLDTINDERWLAIKGKPAVSGR